MEHSKEWWAGLLERYGPIPASDHLEHWRGQIKRFGPVPAIHFHRGWGDGPTTHTPLDASSAVIGFINRLHQVLPAEITQSIPYADIFIAIMDDPSSISESQFHEHLRIITDWTYQLTEKIEAIAEAPNQSQTLKGHVSQALRTLDQAKASFATHQNPTDPLTVNATAAALHTAKALVELNHGPNAACTPERQISAWEEIKPLDVLIKLTQTGPSMDSESSPSP